MLYAGISMPAASVLMPMPSYGQSRQCIAGAAKSNLSVTKTTFHQSYLTISKGGHWAAILPIDYSDTDTKIFQKKK
jgi:hypothetical protein